MTLTPDEEALAVRYLEGDLTGEERSRVEERLFEDDEYVDELEALQDELVNDYVLNRLAPDRRRRFERSMEGSATLRRDVELTRALRGAISSARAARSEPPRRRWLTWPTVPAADSPTLRFGLAAAVLLAVAMGSAGLFVRQHTAALSREMAELRALQQGTTAREQALAGELARVRADGEALKSELVEQQARAEKLERQLAGTPGGAPVVEFVLSQVRTVRSEAGELARPRVLAIAPGAGVRLRAVLPAAAAEQAVRVELQTADGETRWSQVVPVVDPGSPDRGVIVTLPPAALPGGTYFLLVGPLDLPLASYEFSVVRR